MDWGLYSAGEGFGNFEFGVDGVVGASDGGRGVDSGPEVEVRFCLWMAKRVVVSAAGAGL